MRLTDLLENLVDLPRDTAATDIHGLTIHGLTVNSAAVSKGDLFFALPGSRHDGRDFIDDAVARGAGAIVTDDRPFERQSAIAMALWRSNGRSSVTMAPAPLATASSIKSRPSCRLPGKAKNKSPLLTAAELTVNP